MTQPHPKASLAISTWPVMAGSWCNSRIRIARTISNTSGDMYDSLPAMPSVFLSADKETVAVVSAWLFSACDCDSIMRDTPGKNADGCECLREEYANL